MNVRCLAVALGATAVLVTGCARNELVLDLYGSVVYEKPAIREVSHTLSDGRREGGAAVIVVTVQGDPGLQATFDIYPGIADRHPMTEVGDGTYSGQLTFPPDNLGGSFTVTGRLRHEKAGEVVLRDPNPLTVARIDRR